MPELNALYPLLFTASAIANEYQMVMNQEPLHKFYGVLETIKEKVFSLTTKKKESDMVVELRKLIGGSS